MSVNRSVTVPEGSVRMPRRLAYAAWLWRERYRASCSELFDWSELDGAAPGDVPEQLLRNAAFACELAGEGERAVVVALVLEADRTPIEKRFRRFCPAGAVELRRKTWESIYRLLPEEEDSLATLRRYLENKTLNLRPSFELNAQATPP